MGGWRQCKLGDLLEIKHGFAFLGEHFTRAGTHIVLTPGNFYDEGGFKQKGDKDKWYNGPIPADYVLNEGDLLVAMTEQAEGLLGSSAIIPRSGVYLHNQRLGLVQIRDRKQANQRFIYYLFNSEPVRQQIRASASGVKIRHTAPSRIADVKVCVPPLPVQMRIAGILSPYDELIENNERRIRILEAMARTLYREWFVHFRFPGHQKLKLVTSSLGNIPLGWGLAILRDLTTKIGSGATPRGGKEAYHTEGIALIRSLNIYDYEFEFSNLAYIDNEQATQLDNVVVEAGDVLLNITGASVARCSMVPSYILPARVNQHVAIIRANPQCMNPYYLLDTINNDQNKQRLLGLAQGGATREALTKDTISNLPILLPPRDLISRYGEVAGPLHAQRETLYRQIHNLRRTRDLLLPRLLSGQMELASMK